MTSPPLFHLTNQTKVFPLPFLAFWNLSHTTPSSPALTLFLCLFYYSHHICSSFYLFFPYLNVPCNPLLSLFLDGHELLPVCTRVILLPILLFSTPSHFPLSLTYPLPPTNCFSFFVIDTVFLPPTNTHVVPLIFLPFLQPLSKD